VSLDDVDGGLHGVRRGERLRQGASDTEAVDGDGVAEPFTKACGRVGVSPLDLGRLNRPGFDGDSKPLLCLNRSAPTRLSMPAEDRDVKSVCA